MISWSSVIYGAVLSALFAAVLVFLIGRERRVGVIAAAAAGAIAGPVAWNAILIAVDGSQFFVDAPVPWFPVSWQDTGSGVFTLAALLLIFGAGPLRAATGRRVLVLSVLAALAAFLTDIYLY